MGRLRGQTVLEYIIFLSVVTVALFFMGPAIKRGLQSLVKVTADQIGNQEMAEQRVNKPFGNGVSNPQPDELLSRTTPTEYDAYLVESKIKSNVTSGRVVRDVAYTSDIIEDQRVETTANSVTDLGFTKQR